MNVRKIKPEDMRPAHYAHTEVLQNEKDRVSRIQKLLKAVTLSHLEHEDVGIVIKLENGELIETYCNLIDYAEDFVMIKGGTTIPLKAIIDVEF